MFLINFMYFALNTLIILINTLITQNIKTTLCDIDWRRSGFAVI